MLVFGAGVGDDRGDEDGSRRVMGSGNENVCTYLKQLCHLPPLLFYFRRVFLLDHAETGYGEFELHFQLVLGRRLEGLYSRNLDEILTNKEDGGAMIIGMN